MTEQEQKIRMHMDLTIPPIFHEDNRAIWDAVRRLMIFILRLLRKYYGYPEITI